MEVKQQQEGEIVDMPTENNNDKSRSSDNHIGKFKKALMAKYPVPQTDQDIQV